MVPISITYCFKTTVFAPLCLDIVIGGALGMDKQIEKSSLGCQQEPSHLDLGVVWEPKVPPMTPTTSVSKPFDSPTTEKVAKGGS